jgi:hypothetical protein
LKILNVAIFNEKTGIENLMFNFPHFEGQIQVDSTLACIKLQDLDIAHWTLPKDQ